MTLPLVRLSGTPYEQGRQHGEALRGRIAHNLEIYYTRLEREIKIGAAEADARALRYAAAIARESPDYAASMRGVAEGSGFGLAAIAVLNVRYELFYDGYVERPRPDGCSAFALLPAQSADGHLRIGENWDWIVGVQGAVLRTTHEDGIETLAFSEAGIVGGKIGLNSAGVGLLINGLTSTSDDWSRLHTPFHVRCYQVLRSGSLDEALAAVAAGDRSCSANFLIAQAPDLVANAESAPHGVALTYCQDGRLVHTNHFLSAAELGIDERLIEANQHSEWRLARLDALLRARTPVALADIQAALRDHDRHPYSICFHIDPAEPPEERYATLTSAIIDLHAGTLLLSDGPPCEAEYTAYSFAN